MSIEQISEGPKSEQPSAEELMTEIQSFDHSYKHLQKFTDLLNKTSGEIRNRVATLTKVVDTSKTGNTEAAINRIAELKEMLEVIEKEKLNSRK